MKEIIDLHKFFEQWFKAEIENNDKTFARLENVLKKEFLLIMPSGAISTRDELLKNLREGYSSHKDDEIPYKLWVQNIKCRYIETDVCVMIYEEWGEVHGKTNARISTAIFHRNENCVNKVEWVHVHEVFIPVKSKD